MILDLMALTPMAPDQVDWLPAGLLSDEPMLRAYSAALYWWKR